MGPTGVPVHAGMKVIEHPQCWS